MKVTAEELIHEVFTQEGVVITIPYPKDEYDSYRERFPTPLSDKAPISKLRTRLFQILTPGSWCIKRRDGEVIRNNRCLLGTLRLSPETFKRMKRPVPADLKPPVMTV